MSDSVMSAENFSAPRGMLTKSMASNEMMDQEAFSPDEGQTSSYQRKLIKEGNISVEVSNLEKGQQILLEWASSFGGYIESSNSSQENISFTVKIPSAKFEEAMEKSTSFGKVKNTGVSVRDVSDQFYDLETRLETRKVLRQKLQSYLKQASSMQDMLKIERELNSVQSEIESMEGRMKRLTNQIDFSTISVFMELPYNTRKDGFSFPDLSDGARRFFANIISFFVWLITALCYLVICGIPLFALLALLYWLLFGKIGIFVKVFKKLKK